MTTEMPLFLLGAGFDADAKEQVGPVFCESYYIGRHELRCAYPLVGDLLRICFPGESLSPSESIEDLFQAAQDKRVFQPIAKLTAELFWADDFVAYRGLAIGPAARESCYVAFFDRFIRADFLTFNYDSLPEIILHHRERWFPHDGYGVPVRSDLSERHRHLRDRRSDSLVIHLHGSLCVYTSSYRFRRSADGRILWREDRDHAAFLFDPHSIGNAFHPYTAHHTLGDYRLRPERRIISPVPDKATGLRREFVREAYSCAERLIVSSEAPLVAIGYSFNPSDRGSYEPLLISAEAAGRALLLVSPDSDEVAKRLSGEYPGLSLQPHPVSFAQWVGDGYPGL